MFRRHNMISLNRRRGVTMVEVFMASSVLVLLSLVTVTGMIAHARMAQSNMSMQRMAEDGRRMLDDMNIAAIDATVIRLDKGPAGNNTVLTFGRPDPAVPGATLFTQYAYLDTDKKPATIRDNRIVRRTVDNPNATDGDQVLEYVSPVNGVVFAQDTTSGKPLFHITARVGDRTYPANNADNALTGPGTQSFVINSSVSQL